MEEAHHVIARLGLARHPEGGWYRETWRAPASPTERAAGTSILYLLDAGERSHWHRVDAAELWIHQAGSPLSLRTADPAGRIETIRLGTDPGLQPQWLVQPHQWQAAESTTGWCLLACVVVPGFRFEGVQLAPEGWPPDAA